MSLDLVEVVTLVRYLWFLKSISLPGQDQWLKANVEMPGGGVDCVLWTRLKRGSIGVSS